MKKNEINTSPDNCCSMLVHGGCSSDFRAPPSKEGWFCPHRWWAAEAHHSPFSAFGPDFWQKIWQKSPASKIVQCTWWFFCLTHLKINGSAIQHICKMCKALFVKWSWDIIKYLQQILQLSQLSQFLTFAHDILELDCAILMQHLLPQIS